LKVYRPDETSGHFCNSVLGVMQAIEKAKFLERAKKAIPRLHKAAAAGMTFIRPWAFFREAKYIVADSAPMPAADIRKNKL
jgi:hypothetical protein